MGSTRTYLLVTMVLFALLTVMHVVRAATGTTVHFGDVAIAPALSWPGAAVAALLAGWSASLLRRP